MCPVVHNFFSEVFKVPETITKKGWRLFPTYDLEFGERVFEPGWDCGKFYTAVKIASDLIKKEEMMKKEERRTTFNDRLDKAGLDFVALRSTMLVKLISRSDSSNRLAILPAR